MYIARIRHNVAPMRRALIVVVASLVSLVVVAPAAAQGPTKYRYWQDLSVTGPFPGQIVLTVAYEDRDGNGKFKAQRVASYHLRVQVSCNPGGVSALEARGNEASKYSYFSEALVNGRFAHRFEDEVEPQVATERGDLNGTLLKRLKRGNQVTRTARVNGAFDVEDWDPVPGVRENCISFGSYSATPCKRWRPQRDRPRWYREWKAPICSIDPWG
jgi:hypothetical protein